MAAVLCAVLTLSLGAAPAWSGSTSADMTDNPASDESSPPAFDLLFLRPIGIVGAGISTLLFLVPILPITLITRPQDIGRPFKTMVVQPVRYVVVDPLGQH